MRLTSILDSTENGNEEMTGSTPVVGSSYFLTFLFAPCCTSSFSPLEVAMVRLYLVGTCSLCIIPFLHLKRTSDIRASTSSSSMHSVGQL
ncbi:hypothetical protein F4821DRAFT_53340 [Hypoxylon rubiginosum]|uniref:Uncharacterized protein n=1 Tax=Hypoxylon rubiginosum TaxID=110542 RepID=A0ACC0CJL5_9PEZI|nr:hypothetical protein F4821DRAFT_53340 [Hypoxylon rubiginosum]